MNNRLPGYVALCAALLLSACATEADLRNQSGRHYSFVINKPFVYSYQTYLNAANICYDGGTPASYFYITGHLAPDNTEGTITLWQGGLATRAMIVSDLAAQDNDTSVHYSVNSQFGVFSDWSKYQGTITRWLNGEMPELSFWGAKPC